jgi:hypothetical protein
LSLTRRSDRPGKTVQSRADWLRASSPQSQDGRCATIAKDIIEITWPAKSRRIQQALRDTAAGLCPTTLCEIMARANITGPEFTPYQPSVFVQVSRVTRELLPAHVDGDSAPPGGRHAAPVQSPWDWRRRSQRAHPCWRWMQATGMRSRLLSSTRASNIVRGLQGRPWHALSCISRSKHDL